MDIIKTKKSEKVFISPISDSNSKERRIWPKVVLVLAIILACALLVAAGFFIYDYFKAKNSDTLVRFVPNTVQFYASIDKSKISNENLKYSDLILASKSAKNILPANLGTTFGNKYAYANLDKASIFIFEDADLELFKNNVISKGSTGFFDYRDIKINEVKLPAQNPFSYLEIDNVLVISDDDDALRKVVDANFDQARSLRYDKYFSQVNKKTLTDSFLFAFSKKNNDLLALLPNFNVLNNIDKFIFDNNYFFLTAKEKDSNIDLKIYSDLNLNKQLSLKEPFKFLPNKTILAYSGNNLQNTYQDLKKEADSNINFLQFLNGFEDQLKNNYGLSFENDLMPLFDNNFEFVVLPDKKDKTSWAMISEVGNENKLSAKMVDIENGLIKYFARQKPREKKIELADGSEGIELLPDTSKFKFVNKDFEIFKIRTLVSKNDKKDLDSFSYCLYDNKLLLASTNDSLKEILKSLDNKNAVISAQIKANNGLLYLNSLDFLNNFGIELKGDLTLGFEDGNSINGLIRLY
ncbi:MAG: DUF3352 domain-containing protein [Patescibacteria group bacterium]|nr:DUF3352 domain-containing protein [Patescibacteria group bacterium]